MAYEMIKYHEGLRLKPYRCPAGKLTIGYGLNLDAGISREEADLLLDYRMSVVRNQLQTVFTPEEFTNMGPARIDAFMDMVYNLGLAGFNQFGKMIKRAKLGEWCKCAAEMINSKWAMQVGNRATTLAEIVKTGKMPERFNYERSIQENS